MSNTDTSSINKIERCLEVKELITQTDLFKFIVDHPTTTGGKDLLNLNDLIKAAEIIQIIAKRDDVQNDGSLRKLQITLNEYINADKGLIDSLTIIDTPDATDTQYIYTVTAQMILLQFRNVVNELCDVCDKNTQCDSLKKFMKFASEKSLMLIKSNIDDINKTGTSCSKKVEIPTDVASSTNASLTDTDAFSTNTSFNTSNKIELNKPTPPTDNNHNVNNASPPDTFDSYKLSVKDRAKVLEQSASPPNFSKGGESFFGKLFGSQQGGGSNSLLIGKYLYKVHKHIYKIQSNF